MSVLLNIEESNPVEPVPSDTEPKVGAEVGAEKVGGRRKKGKAKRKGKRPMNAFFKIMLASKKKKLPSFIGFERYQEIDYHPIVEELHKIGISIHDK